MNFNPTASWVSTLNYSTVFANLVRSFDWLSNLEFLTFCIGISYICIEECEIEKNRLIGFEDEIGFNHQYSIEQIGDLSKPAFLNS